MSRIAPVACTAVILAAGKGTRFDAEGRQQKLLAFLPSGNRVAAQTAALYNSVFARVIAVVRPDQQELIALFRAAACEPVPCPNAEGGMGHSLAAGVAAAEHSASVMIALADMPFIQTSTLQMLAQLSTDESRIVQPQFQAQPGHPVRFPAALYPQLKALEGDQGARALLRSFPVLQVPVTDAGVVQDIDFPADLQMACGKNSNSKFP